MHSHDSDIADSDLDALIAELAADGIVLSKDDARHAVVRLAKLLLLISAPLPLPPPSDQQAIPGKEAQFLWPDEQSPAPGEPW